MQQKANLNSSNLVDNLPIIYQKALLKKRPADYDKQVL